MLEFVYNLSEVKWLASHLKMVDKLDLEAKSTDFQPMYVAPDGPAISSVAGPMPLGANPPPALIS